MRIFALMSSPEMDDLDPDNANLFEANLQNPIGVYLSLEGAKAAAHENHLEFWNSQTDGSHPLPDLDWEEKSVVCHEAYSETTGFTYRIAEMVALS